MNFLKYPCKVSQMRPTFLTAEWGVISALKVISSFFFQKSIQKEAPFSTSLGTSIDLEGKLFMLLL